MTTFRVIDIETTGMEPPAEIIEIGWQDVIADDQGVRLGATGSALYGALNGIPPETQAVFLDELDPQAGADDDTPEPISCGITCFIAEQHMGEAA